MSLRSCTLLITSLTSPAKFTKFLSTEALRAFTDSVCCSRLPSILAILPSSFPMASDMAPTFFTNSCVRAFIAWATTKDCFVSSVRTLGLWATGVWTAIPLLLVLAVTGEGEGEAVVGFMANTGSFSPGSPLLSVPSADFGPASMAERSASRLDAAFDWGDVISRDFVRARRAWRAASPPSG